jgi:SAM-dependent methyltransferase
LEIGAGVGRIGCHLTAIAGHYTGTDISANMLKIAREEMGDDANFELVELEEAAPLPFPDDSFDAVFSQAVFIHLDREDCYRYMKEAARVVKPGGRVYFQFYNLLHPEGFNLFEWVSDNTVTKDGKVRGRVHFLTATEVRAYMQGAGLTVDEEESHLENVDQTFEYPLPMLNYDYYLIAVGTVPGKSIAALSPQLKPAPPSDSYCDHYISGFFEKLARVTGQDEELETLRGFLDRLSPVDALCCTHAIERGALEAARRGIDPNLLIPALHRASGTESDLPLSTRMTLEIRAALDAPANPGPTASGE